MQQLHGREFSIEQEVALQFTESSWNGFMRILFQIPAELKKQLPIDPRMSDPRTTLQKILESDIWAIKEGNNLLLLSRCFVLPCTLVKMESNSLLRVHSCRQTSDGDAVTAFNEGVLIKASWVILLPEDSFVSTTAAESLYSFFFPEKSVPDIRPKNERVAQPAASSVVPPVVQSAAPPAAEIVVEKPIVQQPQPWAEIVKSAPQASVTDSNPVSTFSGLVASATPPVPTAASSAPSAPAPAPAAAVVPAVVPAPAMVAPEEPEHNPVFTSDNMYVAADATVPQPPANPADWNSGIAQESGQPAEKLSFNFSGGELSGAVSELVQGDALFSLDPKSAKNIPEKGISEPGNVNDENKDNAADKNADKNAEKGTVTIKYSEGYTVEASPDFMNEFLKKPGSSAAEVTAPSAGSGSAKNDSVMYDVNKNSAPAASATPPFDNNRVFGAAANSMASLKQGTIDEIVAKMNALNDIGNSSGSAGQQSQSVTPPQPSPSIQDTADRFQRNTLPPVQRNVAPAQPQPPQAQRPQPFISQPVNRTMAEPAASPANPVVQSRLEAQAPGQQVQPFQTNRMGMAMVTQPIEAAKPAAPKMANSTKADAEPLMSQNQIDALIANLKGGQ